jgi:hypothetical protein
MTTYTEPRIIRVSDTAYKAEWNFTPRNLHEHPRLKLFPEPRVNKSWVAKIPPFWWFLLAGAAGAAGLFAAIRIVAWVTLKAGEFIQ